MGFNLGELLLWSARVASIFVVMIWLAGIFFFYDGDYFLVGIMIWVILLLTTLIAWKSDPFGGIIFIILGIIYVIVIMGKGFSFEYLLAAAPLFVTGLLFIVHYFYQEKKLTEGRGDL